MSIDITTLAIAKEYTNRMIGSGGTGSGVNGKDGITPHIGDNGNWFIGTVDTEVHAQGPAGKNGVTPHIGTDGNWYIGSTNTGVSAKGAKGDGGANGGHYTPIVTQPTSDTMQISFTPSKSDMPEVNPATVNLPVSENSGENVNGIVPSGRVIDLKKYGITATDYEPPFTEEMYHVAYANGTGIQKAIDDAKAAGMTDVVLPAGRYPVCYHAAAKDERNPIIYDRGMSIHATGATLYVIYDEEGVNPYYSWTEDELAANNGIKDAHVLMGKVLNCTGNVYGLTTIGERALRKHEYAKNREFSGGFQIGTGSDGNILRNCKALQFSGDGFCGDPTYENAYVSGDIECTKGTIINGVITPGEGAGVLSPRMGIGYGCDITKPITMSSTGYNYFLWTKRIPALHFYTQDEVYIDTVYAYQSEPFMAPEGAFYVYVELYPGNPETQSMTLNFRLGNMMYRGTVLENCESYQNQRGGFSNLPTGAVMRRCIAHDNGGAYGDMPAFYDGTQFGFDQEDWYVREVTLEDCAFYGNLHDILFRCNKISIKGTTVMSIVKSLNYATDVVLEDCKFFGPVVLDSPAEFGIKRAIGCEFHSSVSQEIDIIEKRSVAPARAVINETHRKQLDFLDFAGNVLFSADMTFFGINPGDAPMADGLLFDIDFTNVDPDALTFDDKTGTVSVEVESADTIVAHGIRSARFNIPVTWKETPVFKDAYSVEIIGFGRAPHMMSLSAAGYTAIVTGNAQVGYLMPSNSNQTAFSSLVSNAPYTKSDGSGGKAAGSVSWNLIDDSGAAVRGNDATIPGLKSMTLMHIVANFYSDGQIEMICNGYPAEENPTTTDFAEWDMSKFTPSFMLWHSNYPNEEQVVRAVRMYNRPLSKMEARNNFAYELNRLGDVRRIIVTATNCTVDNRPVVNSYGKPYAATVAANDGYTLEGATVTVMMGDEDVTETAYADGVINIETVTDDVTITVTAVAATTE